MLTFSFKKVHGSRNDFILIDEKDVQTRLTHEEKEKLALILCNRETGIGADGILFVKVGGRTDGVMSIYNSDGTVASMCGNGLRCAGRYILEQTGKEEVIVETLKADLYVKKYADTEEELPFYQVEIAPVLFDPQALPMVTDKDKVINETFPSISADLQFTAVAVPNPHLIALVTKDIMLSGEQQRIAAYLNGENPYFPDGVNVSFVYPMSAGEVFVNTYERGVGFTNACGTAMSASSLDVILHGLHEYETPLTVYNNGGYVKTIVHLQNGKHWIDLIGNGSYVYDGDVTIDLASGKIVDHVIIHQYEDERVQYESLEQKAKKIREEIFGKSKI